MAGLFSLLSYVYQRSHRIKDTVTPPLLDRSLFSFTNTRLGVSVIYPIYGSFKSFEKYQTSAIAASTGSVAIGSIQVPLVSILKKAAANSANSVAPEHFDEDLLQLHLLQTQKWLIYWTVYASYSVIESLLFLSILPFYSLLKTALFIWLLTPVFISSATTREIKMSEIQQEWLNFLQSGCGLVYYEYVKPFLSNEMLFLDKINMEQFRGYAGNIPGISLVFSRINLANFVNSEALRGSFTGAGTNESPILTSWASFALNTINLSKQYAFGSTTETKTATTKDADTEDFDIVDKPKDLPEGVKERTKKGWIW